LGNWNTSFNLRGRRWSAWMEHCHVVCASCKLHEGVDVNDLCKGGGHISKHAEVLRGRREKERGFKREYSSVSIAIAFPSSS
jgi:hypothetical protein